MKTPEEIAGDVVWKYSEICGDLENDIAQAIKAERDRAQGLVEDVIKAERKQCELEKQFLVQAMEREAKGLVEALDLISKNNTEDCDIYTMGCDCDEVAIKALAAYRGEEVEE